MEYRGIPASNGIAMGKAHVVKEMTHTIQEKLERSVEDEITAYKEAIVASKKEVEEIRNITLEKLDEEHADIFDAHLALLDDPSLVDGVANQVVHNHVSASYALKTVTEQYVQLFENLDDPYLRERSKDVQDVSNRIMDHLLGNRATVMDLSEKGILFAHDLTPSDTAKLDPELVLGFVTVVGGRTSHTAIMARSLGIPAVVGIGKSAGIEQGDFVIVDGDEGLLLVNPDDSVRTNYRHRMENKMKVQEKLKQLLDTPTTTLDGETITLLGNIGSPNEVNALLQNGADGVGLYRSEFLFMNRSSAPSEEEQYKAYKEVLEKMEGKPVTIRTLDIGGDKEIPYLNLEKEANPFLGYRAIRLCLQDKPLFKTQLRALLRASKYGALKIMYPMITSLQEVKLANAFVEEAKAELSQEKRPFGEVKIGIMIETPAAAIISDLLAKEVDFFSIGTNDLIQYTLAADRLNDKVAYLYEASHPAVIRSIKWIIQNARQAGIEVSMCGEMASDLKAIPLLISMGLRSFSMGAASLLPAKQLLLELNEENGPSDLL